jgi:hypothetical protein
MWARGLLSAVAGGALAALSACAATAPDAGPVTTQGTFRPEYMGAEIVPLDAALFQFKLAMRGARGVKDVEGYARCVVAGYTNRLGFGFARHVRTKVDEEGGIWRADAVYTISPALPRGLKTIDAEVTVADCAELGIPTA